MSSRLNGLFDVPTTTCTTQVPGRSRFFTLQNLVLALLLSFAAIHCTRSVFFDNVSWIDLRQYALGQERMPFQGRIALMPLLRWAGQNRAMSRIAAAADNQSRHQLGRRDPQCAEVLSPEKLACELLGILCGLLAIGALARVAWKLFPDFWWLPPTVALAILYASFAARFEEAYWYPYDFPHMLLFGGACLCLLVPSPLWLFLALALCDIPMRETSIFLLFLALPFLVQRLRWPRALVSIGFLGLVWGGTRVYVHQHFAANLSEQGARFYLNTLNLRMPLHWPQMASAFGFLGLPLWWARKRLSREHQLFLWLTLPCLAVTATYAIWIESRATLEWTMPLALLGSLEVLSFARERGPSPRNMPAVLHGTAVATSEVGTLS